MGSQPDSPSSEDSGDETPGLDLPLSPGMENLTPEDVPGVVGVSQNNPYGCQFCDKAFPRLSFLKIHEQVHSKKWKKVICLMFAFWYYLVHVFITDLLSISWLILSCIWPWKNGYTEWFILRWLNWSKYQYVQHRW